MTIPDAKAAVDKELDKLKKSTSSGLQESQTQVRSGSTEEPRVTCSYRIFHGPLPSQTHRDRKTSLNIQRKSRAPERQRQRRHLIQGSIHEARSISFASGSQVPASAKVRRDQGFQHDREKQILAFSRHGEHPCQGKRGVIPVSTDSSFNPWSGESGENAFLMHDAQGWDSNARPAKTCGNSKPSFRVAFQHGSRIFRILARAEYFSFANGSSKKIWIQFFRLLPWRMRPTMQYPPTRKRMSVRSLQIGAFARQKSAHKCG